MVPANGADHWIFPGDEWIGDSRPAVDAFVDSSTAHRRQLGQSRTSVIYHSRTVEVQPFWGALDVIGDFVFMKVVFTHHKLLEIDFKQARLLGYHRRLKAMDEFPASRDSFCVTAVHLQNPHGCVSIEGPAFLIEGCPDVNVWLHCAMQSGQP